MRCGPRAMGLFGRGRPRRSKAKGRHALPLFAFKALKALKRAFLLKANGKRTSNGADIYANGETIHASGERIHANGADFYVNGGRICAATYPPCGENVGPATS